MITDVTGKLIALLLAGILAVLLFGRDNVLASGYVFVAIALVVGLLALIFFIFRAAIRPIIEDYRLETNRPDVNGRQRFLLVISYAGMAGNVITIGWAVVLALQGEPFKNTLSNLPYFWVPVLLFSVSYALYWLDKQWVAWRRRRRTANEPY